MPTVRLRGVDFAAIENGSGARGFFSEKEYWYHHALSPWKALGMTFAGCGFVAKTTTFDPREGNMPRKEDGITPSEWKPKCIIVRPLEGVMLNAVGLAGPGAPNLIERGTWQKRKDPHFISFMAVSDTVDSRLQEHKAMVGLLHKHKPEFNAPFGVEENISCPNVGKDPSLLVDEVGAMLDIVAPLNVPIRLKFNALVPPMAVARISKHPACDAITISNTIPWGLLPEKIDWEGLFGSEKSPLAHLGGGGLSGWPLRAIVCDWIQNARDCGLTKPTWVCGGIDSAWAVRQAKNATAHGVQVCSVAIQRPWRMRNIIRTAHELFS